MSALVCLPLLVVAALGWAWWRGGSRTGYGIDLLALAALLLLLLPIATADPAATDATAPTVALVVDVSTSMAAGDAAPSRLEQAKRELRTLVGGLPGARFALLPFAGEAVVQVPVSTDREALLFFIDRLTPGLVAAPGSGPEEALQLAAQTLAGLDGERAIVLFSDGERTLPGRPPPRDLSLPVHVVPLGSESGAPLNDRHGLPRRDANGQSVISRCDRPRLATLASSGTLLEAIDSRPAVQPLLQRWQRSAPQAAVAFPWPAGLACVLLLLPYLPWRLPPRRAATLATLLLCVACRASTPEAGWELFRQAVQLAATDRPEQQTEAAELFAAAARRLDGGERGAALFNRGTLLLAAGQPEPALAALEQALLLRPGDESVRRNFVLALRTVGPQRTPGVGEGESESTDGQGDGSALERAQALQLLESVRPEAAALTASDRTVREIRVTRDW